jgi:hypothetical protein
MAEKRTLLTEQRREAAEAERASAEEQRRAEAEKVHLLEARLERLELQVQGSLHAIHDPIQLQVERLQQVMATQWRLLH